MKYGQKPAEPRMEDVLASIRRSIDETAHGRRQDQLGGSSMTEMRMNGAWAHAEPRNGRSYDQVSAAPASSGQGFARILSLRAERSIAEASSPREASRPREPAQRHSEPVVVQNGDDGQNLYDGYYASEIEDYTEPSPEDYQAPSPARPERYLPLPPPVAGVHRHMSPPKDRLMSEASSDATQAAFGRLAETLTRRALGERPIADVTQELLRGMLKQWLDDNLPKIVERLVREEIERVVRRPR